MPNNKYNCVIFYPVQLIKDKVEHDMPYLREIIDIRTHLTGVSVLAFHFLSLCENAFEEIVLSRGKHFVGHDLSRSVCTGHQD